MTENTETQTTETETVSPVVPTVLMLEEYIEAATDAGLLVEEQSRFIKIFAPDLKKAIYVGKKKGETVITRLDVSGFSIENEAATAPPRRNGKVRHQFNPSASAEALDAAWDALDALSDNTLQGDKVRP